MDFLVKILSDQTYITSILAAVVAAYTGWIAARRKKKEGLAFTLEHVNKRLITLEGEVTKLTEEKRVLVEENRKLLDKIYLLERRVSEDFNHLSVISGYYMHLPKPAWLKDSEGQYIYVNNEYSSRFGVSTLSAEGHTDTSIWGEAYGGIAEANDAKVMQHGVGIKFEEDFPSAPGSEDTRNITVVRFPVVHNNAVLGVGGIAIKVEDPLQE